MLEAHAGRIDLPCVRTFRESCLKQVRLGNVALNQQISLFFRRIQYRKDAQNAYQQRMLEAHTGQSDFPRVRTFRQLDNSTNNVFDDLKEAERWTGVQGKVDMAELTWEQRERILRMLFAKMNGFKEKRRYGG